MLRNYGSLNKNSLHRFIDLNAWEPVTGAIRKCGFVGVSVTLLEKVCDWGWPSRFEKLKSGPLSLPVYCWCRYLTLCTFPSTVSVWLPHNASFHDVNAQNLQNCKPVLIKCFYSIRVAMILVSFHINRTLTKTETIFIKKWGVNNPSTHLHEIGITCDLKRKKTEIKSCHIEALGIHKLS